MTQLIYNLNFKIRKIRIKDKKNKLKINEIDAKLYLTCLILISWIDFQMFNYSEKQQNILNKRWKR